MLAKPELSATASLSLGAGVRLTAMYPCSQLLGRRSEELAFCHQQRVCFVLSVFFSYRIEPKSQRLNQSLVISRLSRFLFILHLHYQRYNLRATAVTTDRYTESKNENYGDDCLREKSLDFADE